MRSHTLQALLQLVESRKTNRRVGGVLALVCGAISAGGLLIVRQQASVQNWDGAAPDIVQRLAPGAFAWMLAGAGSLTLFVAGAATTGVLIARAQHLRLHWDLAHPLVLEGFLLLLFGALGGVGEWLGEWFLPAVLGILCFGLGMQSAVINTISRSEINATDRTGILTWLGLELGRWTHGGPAQEGDVDDAHEMPFVRLAFHASILGFFVIGCFLGAIAFAIMGYMATIPLAVMVMAPAIPSMLRDRWAADEKTGSEIS
ncbi:hypothetical protein BKP43_64310 [Variovorax boronicumulans]|nr:hypothetical protein BKP43_64310 [Variovorax boronicumulans]